MSKRSFFILIVSLLLILSLFSIVSSVNADEKWEEGYWYESHKEWFNYHTFNGTVVDKEAVYPLGYIQYLINVSGTTFILQTYTSETQEFYVGDKITMYGSAVNEQRNFRMYSLFDDKYHNRKFPRIHLGKNDIRLADGFVRGGGSSTTTKSSGSMSILNGTIITGSGADDKTKCTIYVGKEYSGKNVKISVLYSSGGENLNKGRKVDKKVSSSGEITVYSKEAFANYPDRAKITIYTHNGKKIDTTIVTLAENSEPQSFDFSNDPKPRKEDPKYASNGAKFVGYAGDGSWANYYKNGHYYTVDGDQID